MRSSAWYLTLAALVLATGAAEAKYIPTPLEDMLGSSDLVVTGSIARVDSESFVLRVEKLVAGEHDAPTLEVQRFRDWACARRWAPYAAGQRVLLCLFRATSLDGEPVWRIRSGGGEGEMPIASDDDGRAFVYYRRGNLPFASDGRYPLHGGELYAVRMPLEATLRTIRAFRRAFSWELDRSTPMPQVVAVRPTTPDAVAEFAAQGDFEAWLVEATRRSRHFRS